MRRRYVLAALGLIGALALTSSALGGPSLNSLIKNEVAKQLSAAQVSKKGKRGPAGPQGPAGPPGQQGIQGNTGAAGSPAASASFGRVNGLNALKAFPILFANPLGATTSASSSGASLVEMGAPNATMVARDLYVTADAAPGAGASQQYEIFIESQASGVLGCTMSGNSQTTCDSGTATGTIPAGDRIALRISNTNNPAADVIDFGWRATTP